MSLPLRITLLMTCLFFCLTKGKAVVQNHVENKIEIATKKQFIKNQMKNHVKKRVKSIKENWKITKSQKKKRFGKIGSITAFVLLSTASFTVLKLTNVIAWSWFWVLSPLIFYIGLIVLIALILIILLAYANS